MDKDNSIYLLRGVLPLLIQLYWALVGLEERNEQGVAPAFLFIKINFCHVGADGCDRGIPEVQLIDNINLILRNNLVAAIKSDCHVSITTISFLNYAFQELNVHWKDVDEVISPLVIQ